MVRLIVGAILNAGYEKITLTQVRESLDLQKALPIQWSVPAKGLCLTHCEYPEVNEF
jgi:tRNA U38,U39,U40 pseudouridine synthase TruA